MRYYIYILTFVLLWLWWCTATPPKPIAIPRAPVSQTQFYFLWDSITAGYQLPIEQSYPYIVWQKLNIKTINAGKSWDTSKWLRDRLNWTIAPANSGDVVFLLIWGNDWLQSLSTAQLTQNIDYIINYILSKNLNIVLLWMQIPTNLDKKYISDFESIYPSLAAKYKIKFLPDFLSGVWWIPDLNISDGIHPNFSWYNILAQKIVNFINTNNLLPN